VQNARGEKNWRITTAEWPITPPRDAPHARRGSSRSDHFRGAVGRVVGGVDRVGVSQTSIPVRNRVTTRAKAWQSSMASRYPGADTCSPLSQYARVSGSSSSSAGRRPSRRVPVLNDPGGGRDQDRPDRRPDLGGQPGQVGFDHLVADRGAQRHRVIERGHAIRMRRGTFGSAGGVADPQPAGVGADLVGEAPAGP